MPELKAISADQARALMESLKALDRKRREHEVRLFALLDRPLATDPKGRGFLQILGEDHPALFADFTSITRGWAAEGVKITTDYAQELNHILGSAEKPTDIN